MISTRITKLFGIEHPIVQGGLAHLAFAELAAAVSNAGGLGQISAASFPDAKDLRREIAKAKVLTHKPFGVNFAIGHLPLEAHLEVTLSENVPVISITGGNPEPILRAVAGTGVKTMVLVASVRQAKKAADLGASAVIAVGYEGGGHIGREDTTTMVLVPRVARAVSIPVLAAGGIADGRGLAAALALGAEGVEMGTRFVATAECPAHPNYKQAIIQAAETDTLIIERPLGRPGRVLKTKGAEQIVEKELAGLPPEELLPYYSGAVNRKAALDGDLEAGYVWAGQAIGLCEDVPSVQTLVTRLVAEAEDHIARLHGLVVRH